MIKKRLIIAAVVLFVVVLVIVVSWPLPLLLLSSIYGYFKSLFSNSSFWLTAGIVAGAIFALVVFVAVVLPILIYFLKKIYVYVSLSSICVRSNYKLKIKRFPFSSLKNMSCTGDLVIETKNKVFYIHFIDIIFANRRALTIPNDYEYVITPVTPSRISKQGAGGTNMSGSRTLAFRATEHSFNRDSDKVKKFPSISITNNEEHILLIPTFPVELKFRGSDSNTSLSSGQKLGSMTFCSVDYLKKGLKNKLHSSIFNN